MNKQWREVNEYINKGGGKNIFLNAKTQQNKDTKLPLLALENMQLGHRDVPFHIQVTELVKHLSVGRKHAVSENVRGLLWR